MRWRALILAAGLGTRMRSKSPKVLHWLGGRPILEWSVRACRQATGRRPCVVVGPEFPLASNPLQIQVDVVIQAERLGTGHAALQAMEQLRGSADAILITYADMPLIRAQTMRRLMELQSSNLGPLSILTVRQKEARGFGRVRRAPDGTVRAIIEEAQATPEDLALEELNAGVYAVRGSWLWDRLPQLRRSRQGEFYLTDLVATAVEAGEEVRALMTTNAEEGIGVNTREHLAEAEAALRQQINRKWMEAGVSLRDPQTTYIGPEVVLGPDTLILPNTHLEGKTTVGRECRIGPNTIVRDSAVGDRCRIEASVVEGSTLEEEVEVGPFAHLRPGAVLERRVHLGNFAEVKASRLGAGVHMGHFSYVGDAAVGPETNIGAGTVTCNFDGERKHPTQIGASAFIGSDTMLVAPVRVGDRARTGAGAVVTRDVPPDSVAVGVPARVIRKLKEPDG